MVVRSTERDLHIETGSPSQAHALAVGILILIWLSYHPRNGVREAFLYYCCSNLELLQLNQLNLEPFRHGSLAKGRKCDVHHETIDKERFIELEIN